MKEIETIVRPNSYLVGILINHCRMILIDLSNHQNKTTN